MHKNIIKVTKAKNSTRKLALVTCMCACARVRVFEIAVICVSHTNDNYLTTN